ncbi:hypothetical protein Ocin01_15348, partial [Orchesella cincta]
MKNLIRRILGNKVVNMEDFNTLLCEVESTMNHRPLSYQSESDGELLPLSPSRFLKDTTANYLPEADTIDSRALKQNLRQCQKIREELRTRFRKEYLWQLNQEMKNHDNWELKPGSVVSLKFMTKSVWTGHLESSLKSTRKRWESANRTYQDEGWFLPATSTTTLSPGVPDNPEEKQEVDQVPEPNPDPVEVSESSVPPKAEVKVTRSGRKVYQPDRFTN